MVRVIREQIGFGGLLMTDDLSMQALDGTRAERATRARGAGCDVVLHCNGKPDEMEAVASAAGRLAPEQSTRGEAALTWRRLPDATELTAIDAELAALMAEHVRA
jgi:beta-N-acetylhexosaminidase